MRKFRGLTVGAKLIIGFSVMIFLLGITGFIGYRSVTHIHQNLEEIYSVQRTGADLNKVKEAHDEARTTHCNTLIILFSIRPFEQKV